VNLKEICESVLEESDGRATQLASTALGRDGSGDLYLTDPTHRNVVRWAQEEYLRIQRLSSHWEFHAKRGKFLTVQADRNSYTKRGIRETKDGSFYFLKSGSTARYPLSVKSYDWWLAQEQVGISTTSSTPSILIDGPEDEWLLWPTPSTAGTVQGAWLIEVDTLENADDVPCWEAQYHFLIKWGVIELYAAEFAGEQSANKLLSRASRMLPPMMAAFKRKYLPSYRNPLTFM